MMKLLKRLWKEEEGQGLVEYGLIIVVVALAVIIAITALGTTLSGVFDDIVTELGGTPGT